MHVSNFAAAAAKSLQLCPTLPPHRWQPTRLLCPWDSPGKNTGVGCHCFFQLTRVNSWQNLASPCVTKPSPAARIPLQAETRTAVRQWLQGASEVDFVTVQQRRQLLSALTSAFTSSANVFCGPTVFLSVKC